MCETSIVIPICRKLGLVEPVQEKIKWKFSWRS